jgi:hypothetical protein
MSLNDVLNLENGKLVARSDLNVYGVLTVNRLVTHELVAHQRYQATYFEFSKDTQSGSNEGTGFLWPNEDYNRQLIWKNNPGRFWSTESIDLAADRAYHIDGLHVLSASTLGGSVVRSNLQSVGNLESLSVLGNVNLNDTVFFNATSGRLSIGTDVSTGVFTVYDNTNDVELVITGGENSRGRIGAVQTRSLDFITDNQARVSIEYNGDVTISHEQDRTATTRVYGKLGVNVKNPEADLEVASTMRFAGKLFASGDGSPKSGTYNKGDIVWNSDPKTNSYIGWVCTANGTPGVWKPFGLIGS